MSHLIRIYAVWKFSIFKELKTSQDPKIIAAKKEISDAYEDVSMHAIGYTCYNAFFSCHSAYILVK